MPAPSRSPHIVRFMDGWFSRFLRRHLGGLRLARIGPAPQTERPLVIYCNHPSWWDAAVVFLLGQKL